MSYERITNLVFVKETRNFKVNKKIYVASLCLLLAINKFGSLFWYTYFWLWLDCLSIISYYIVWSHSLDSQLFKTNVEATIWHPEFWKRIRLGRKLLIIVWYCLNILVASWTLLNKLFEDFTFSEQLPQELLLERKLYLVFILND